MIEKIRIKNYRGIKSLEIDNLKNIIFLLEIMEVLRLHL